ncbi:hypothetical protein V6C32_09795 [Desulforamulus ruminis]
MAHATDSGKHISWHGYFARLIFGAILALDFGIFFLRLIEKWSIKIVKLDSFLQTDQVKAIKSLLIEMLNK